MRYFEPELKLIYVETEDIVRTSFSQGADYLPPVEFEEYYVG